MHRGEDESGSGGSVSPVYQYNVDLTDVEELLTAQNELLTEQREEMRTHLEALESYTVSTVALLGVLIGAVLGIAVARLFYSLWRV